MGKIVSQACTRQQSGRDHRPPSILSLYAPTGAGGSGRKYLNLDERRRVLAAAHTMAARPALFALTLAWTGARVSEVLALTPRSFQIEQSLVAIVTLKRRGWFVREVPLPPELMETLEQEFSIQSAQHDSQNGDARLWPISRVTAWRLVKRVMDVAGVSGRPACPRGLRHSFGVGTVQAGVPITLLQKWMGHARLSSTGIYAAVSGPEEFAMAKKFWDK
jgi:integrase